MKKTLLALLCIFILSGINTLSAQTGKEVKKKVEKEIEVEEVDGETTVTITEKEGGKITKKVYSGEEAKEYLESRPQGKTIFISEDENSGSEKVVIMKMDGDHQYNWTNKSEINEDLSNMDAELEALKNELDNLSKEEIAARLDKLIEQSEERKEVHIVKIEQDGDDNIFFTDDEINVEVEEKDGVMIITKTIGDSKTVEEIVIDEDNKQQRVYVIKSDSDDSEKLIEYKGRAIKDDIEVNVLAKKGNAGLSIELILKTDEMANVKVTDPSGKEVYTRSVQGISTHNLDVKLKKPASGTYVIEVVQGSKTVKLKTDLK